MPKISVLMSVFNRAKYVGEAIESVIQQTFTDWELIIVNDGSSDGSEKVVQRYNSYLTYLDQPNRGMSSGLNRAFRNSTGEYIAFLSSDDLLLPHSLERLSNCLDEKPEIGLVHSDGYLCDDEGEVFDRFSTFIKLPPGRTSLEQLAQTNTVNIVDSALTRRSWLEFAEGPFDEQMFGYEDWDLCIRLAGAGCNFLYLDEPTFKYRVHPSQKSSPKSRIHQLRQKSLAWSRLKLIAADYFSNLSLSVRKHVFYVLLIDLLEGQLEKQQEVLQSASFRALPDSVRADLFYYTGVDNILEDREITIGRSRILRAKELNPHIIKYRLALTLSNLGILPLELVIRPRRKIHQYFNPPEQYLPVGQNIRIQRQSQR